MRQNEINFVQTLLACLFVSAIVCVGIVNRMGPFQQSLLKAKYTEIQKKYIN